MSIEASPLALTDAGDGRELLFTPRRVVLAGYTGRDRAQVQRHIDELLAQGIPAPAEVPELYPGLPGGVQVEGRLQAAPGWSSGEVEYVLLLAAGGPYVGVGSDHTDRELERTAVVPAKQAFPKIIGPRVRVLAQLSPGWDDLVLRSWIAQGSERFIYQESPLAAILAPDDLLALIPEQDRREGLVVYSGTVAAHRPAPTTGHCRFEAELSTVQGDRLLSCSYEYEAGPAHH
jgi:hypothetical protein